MAEKRQLPDFERYQYAALAARMAGSEENARYVPGALELLAYNGLGMKKETAEGFVRGSLASEDGIKTVMGTYLQKYEAARNQYKPMDMALWYDSILSKISKGAREKILGTLAKYDETLESLTKKYARASHIVKGKNLGANSAEEVAEAEKTIEKYKGVVKLLGTLENSKFDQLRGNVVNETSVNELEQIASKL